MEQIRNILETIKSTSKEVIPFQDNGDFHHNSPYKHGLSILKNGILINAHQSEHGVIRPTHVEVHGSTLPIDTANGNEKISLARMVGEIPYYGQDTEYNSYDSRLVDFIVSEQLQKDGFFGRSYKNYYNEYLVPRDIPRSYIKNLDVRFHNMSLLKDTPCFYYGMTKELFIENYNHFIDMARFIVDENLSIPIREVINNQVVYILEQEKVAKLEKVKIR